MSLIDLINNAVGNPGNDNTNALMRFGQALQGPSVAAANVAPSDVREYQYYNALSPDMQKQYLTVKRANQLANLGGSYAVVGQDGSVVNTLPVTLKPADQPVNAANKTQAEAEGKATGEANASLADISAGMPQVQEVVKNLSDLGQRATYTGAGVTANTLKRQAGLDVGEGANAREKYINTVNDTLLPLLRQTFGAQFTQKEGDTLKATLGDPNKSPSEKDSALSAFLQQKQQQQATLQRRTGNKVSQTPSETKVIGGKTYQKIGGQWFSQ